ncbi:MAG: DUF4388 domain-containing protein [Sporichthyaceae bacterium]
MKLEGSLDAFSLPDIFQLLSFTKKTGGLHLAHDGADGVVFFAGGQVTGASADSSRQPLARRLVGSGSVADEVLSAAVEAASTGERLGIVRAFLEQGAVDSELLRRAATDQSVDAVFDLLRWRNGDFAFVVDETNPDDVGVTLSVESVLADTEARRVTWESVSAVVPSPRAVLAMPVVLPAEPQVSREEWSLLALVDGRRSVTDLVDLTGSGQYAVVSTLAALVQRGLLEVRPAEGEDGADEDHVAVVLRRQALLAPLEGQPFVPVQEPAATVVDDAVKAEADTDAEVAKTDTDTDAEVAKTDTDTDTATDIDTDGDVAADDEDTVQEEPSTPAVEVGAVQAPTPAAAEPSDDGTDERELASASAPAGPTMLGGAHVPQDVVPPRPEPFLPRRQADFDETGQRPAAALRTVPTQVAPSASLGDVVGATATAPDASSSVIERDPNVNRSLMLRLIAGVRGL